MFASAPMIKKWNENGGNFVGPTFGSFAELVASKWIPPADQPQRTWAGGVEYECFDGVWLPTNQSAEAAKATTGKILLLSESILAVGSFPSKLATATGRTVDRDVAIGGSHIGVGLAAVAEECWSRGYADNACAYSDDLTATGWAHINANDCTVQKAVLGGENWTKFTNNLAAATPGMRYTAAIPATGDVICFMAEVRGRIGDLRASGVFFNIRRMDTMASLLGATIQIDRDDVGFTVCVTVPAASASPLFGTGINLGFEVRFADATANCNFYVRNITVSYRQPSGFSPFVKTSGSAATGSLAWIRHWKQAAGYNYASAVISFGRNESAAYVAPRSHGKAYRALAKAARSLVSHIVVTNPPCQVYDSQWDERTYSPEYTREFKKVMTEVGCGLDVQEGIQENDPADVMSIVAGFSQHENDAGADWMVARIAPLLERSESRAPNVMGRPVRVYWDGVRTGSWTQITGTSASLRRKRSFDLFSSGSDAPLLGAYSSTAGDTVAFATAECSQIHVLLAQGTGLGTFSVTIDGVVVGVIDTAIGGQPTPHMIAKFGAGDIPDTAHTVVLTVLTGTVHIYGIVTV